MSRLRGGLGVASGGVDCLKLVDYFRGLVKLTRAETAQTMAYSENHLQSRQLQTEKTVADF